MLVYRGGSQKEFIDDSHTLVADVDLSASLARYDVDRAIVEFNLSKEPIDRQSIGHIVFDGNDLAAISGVLVKLLTDRSNELKVLSKKHKQLEGTIRSIRYHANHKSGDQMEKIRDLASLTID